MVQSLLATRIAFVSCMLFILSSYRQRLNPHLVQDQLAIDPSGNYAFTSVHFLRFLPFRQPKRVKGSRLFSGKRHNIEKFMMMIVMMHGLLTVSSVRVQVGRVGFSLDNNYIISLTSTATVLGIIFVMLLLLLPDERKRR